MIKKIKPQKIREEFFILIIDDRQKDIDNLQQILIDANYLVLNARSTKQAMKILDSDQQIVDLILIDVESTCINDLSTCKYIRSQASSHSIPIILIMDKPDEDEDEDKEKESLQLGTVDFFHRPFRPSELLARIQNYINLRIQIEELTQLNHTKDRFFSIIAHDLRSPLSGLLGVSQILLEDVNLMSREEITDISNQITSSAKLLFSLLENLLEWSRIQVGSIKYDPIEFNLYEITENIEGLFTGVAIQKNIDLQIPYQEKPLLVYADENMLFTVLRNLVSNALKFTSSEGKVELNILEKDHQFLEIAVSDSGIGIPEEILQKLFTIGEYKTRPGTNNEKGTGLGLILVKELVEANGGSIEAESEDGIGTLFRFTVPRIEGWK